MNSAAKTILYAIAAAALVWWASIRPVKSGPEHHHAIAGQRCEPCGGKGECPACGGFGNAPAQGACAACKGTGKLNWRFGAKDDAPCTKCRGTGNAEARQTCPACEGAGKCKICSGSGRTTALKATAAIGNSPWEWLLLLLDVPIDPNPCPQRSLRGGYPIVERYLALHFQRPRPRIKEWGEFLYDGDGWRMVCPVELSDESGATSTRTMEFKVKDRLLVGCRRLP